jgi:hypothetical protein
MQKQLIVVLAAIALAVSNCAGVMAAEAKRPPEWDKTVEAARKEAKIVIAIPPVNELRKELEIVLKQKFGIEAELLAASGPKNPAGFRRRKKPA